MCNCGTTLTCQLNAENKEADILCSFKILPGTGMNCGSSYLRKGEQEEALHEIQNHGCVDAYRTAQAKNKMRSGDPVPPSIRSSNVLHAM